MKQLIVLFSALLLGLSLKSQPFFTKADTLRGSLNENRDWFDILKYDIDVNPNIETKSISGFVIWRAKAIKATNKIQIDLQQPLEIDSILINNGEVGKNNVLLNDWIKIPFTRSDNIAIATPNLSFKINSEFSVWIYYHGIPREAVRPPWDGGWIWKKDANGKPWISVACQGLGASVWYPCKDIQSDEPDQGASIRMFVPEGTKLISNGRPVRTDMPNHYSWQVKNPINNYTIIPYIGDYVGWSDIYKGLKGDLDVHYWVLREDSSKARNQFKQVHEMLKAFEYWFGPYPFYED